MVFGGRDDKLFYDIWLQKKAASARFRDYQARPESTEPISHNHFLFKHLGADYSLGMAGRVQKVSLDRSNRSDYLNL